MFQIGCFVTRYFLAISLGLRRHDTDGRERVSLCTMLKWKTGSCALPETNGWAITCPSQAVGKMIWADTQVANEGRL